MTEKELKDLGKQLKDYCDRYLISTNYLFEILNDQKVTPMIRGKATEYEVYLLLKSYLNKSELSVQKLNLLPSPGLSDEDISITHLRTGKVLKVESKNAVRGSISNGLRSRIHNVPHFKVKCHRSRSNIKLAGSSNDRYSVKEFDIIITQVQQSYLLKAAISNSYMGGIILWRRIFWYWPDRGRGGDPGGLEGFPGHPWQRGSEAVPVLPPAHFDVHQGGKVPADVGPLQLPTAPGQAAL